MTVSEWTERYGQSVMNTFGTPQTVLIRGEGSYVWDADGKKYLDLLGGIAVNALGHGNQQLIEAVSSQLSTLGHVSNFFATEPQIKLAERLLELVGAPGRVFFTNSGAEANEAGLKLTRRTGRSTIIAMHGAFHGRTMGALALTSKEGYRAPFEPLPGNVRWAPYGDASAVEALIDESVAAVVVEPLQGEAGVIEPPPDYLPQLRDITQRHGALLWLDEVQTGIGRTGDWFGFVSSDVIGDVITLAKGLGGGVPIGACIATNEASQLLGPGTHGSTFGGNPVAAAAGLAVLNAIESQDLLQHVRNIGSQLRDDLTSIEQVSHVDGRGLMLGVALNNVDAPSVVTAARELGLITNAPTSNRLRIVPPLNLTSAEAAEAVRLLSAAISKVATP